MESSSGAELSFPAAQPGTSGARRQRTSFHQHTPPPAASSGAWRLQLPRCFLHFSYLCFFQALGKQGKMLYVNCKVSSFASSFKETACLCTNPHLLLKDSLNLYEPSELRPAGCGGESFSPIFPICEYFYQSEQQAAVWLLQHLMLIFYVCRLKDHSDTGKYF